MVTSSQVATALADVGVGIALYLLRAAAQDRASIIRRLERLERFVLPPSE